jgi:8-oxo-dGTP pyrophosphatase MutT (NUDIX family)
VVKQVRTVDDDGAEVGLQYAALPWRRAPALEIMLITSRETRRWVIPKGWPMEGRSPPEAAAQEAYEEAGLTGKVSEEPLGVYRYAKGLKAGDLRTRVEVHAMEVEAQASTWPEQKQRETRWFPAAVAAARVDEPELQELILAFAKKNRTRSKA